MLIKASHVSNNVFLIKCIEHDDVVKIVTLRNYMTDRELLELAAKAEGAFDFVFRMVNL